MESSCGEQHDLEDIIKEDYVQTDMIKVSHEKENFNEWYFNVLKYDAPLLLLFNEEGRIFEEEEESEGDEKEEEPTEKDFYVDSYEMMMDYLIRKERVDNGFDQIGEILWKFVETPFMMALLLRSVQSLMIVIEAMECGIETRKFEHPIIYCDDPYLMILVCRSSIREIKVWIESPSKDGRLVASYTIENVCKRLGIYFIISEENKLPRLNRLLQKNGRRRTTTHKQKTPTTTKTESYGITDVIKSFGLDLELFSS